MKQPSSQRRWVLVLRVIGTLLTLGLVVRWISQQGWGEILEGVGQIGWPLSTLALLMLMISRMAVVARWFVLLRAAGNTATYWEAARLTFAGMFASNFLPTTIGGDVLRLAAAKQLRLDRATCAASLVVDRLVAMAGMVLVLPVGLVILFRETLAAGWVLPVCFAGAANGMDGGQSRWESLRGRIRRFGVRFLEALKIWLRRPVSLASAFSFTLLHMLMLFSMIGLLLGAQGEDLPFLRIAGMWSLIYFITLIPISINGLGVQELSLTYVFSHLGGVSMQAALTLALLIRTLFWLASLPGAFFLPALLSRKQEELSSGPEVPEGRGT